MGDDRRGLLAAVARLKSSENSPYVAQLCSALEECLEEDSDSDRFRRAVYEAVLNPPYTLKVAEHFKDVIVEVVTASVIAHLSEGDAERTTFDSDRRHTHILNCLLLGKLVRLHPDILPLSLKYFDAYPSPFEWHHTENDVSKRRKIESHSLSYSIDSFSIVECCHSFLNVAPDVFRRKWNWSSFIASYVDSKNDRIRWLLYECVRIVAGMSEFRCDDLKMAQFGSNTTVKYTLEFQNEANLCNNIFLVDREKGNKKIIASDYLVDVSGIYLTIYDEAVQENGHLVPVQSTMDNLRSLALAVASGKAACLMGSVGCGKTSLVEHLALVTGRKNILKKIQLGDQTDSRTLLGTYTCTDIPGEFIWQPGVVTEAVQKGHWLLLEDIDCAAIDVASVLSSLLERNVLSVPGYRDSIPIASGFQLFFTKRNMSTDGGNSKSNSNVIALLSKHWIQINIEPLSRQELVVIINKLYPMLKTISTRMVDAFMLFSVGDHNLALQSHQSVEESSHLLKTLSVKTPEVYSRSSGRFTSTRDLLKWCSRAVIDFDVSKPESAIKVLQDAIDIFACSLPDMSSRLYLAQTIGAFLGIVETKAEYLCTLYKPQINLSPDVFRVGRATVLRKQQTLAEMNLNEKKVTFSHTRPSACLLERISCCVNMKEPVLLVGETGTGKTSSVQYLAKETGHKLIVINMNQQSDSADLLGGYKPVDLKFIILPIKNEFERLFRNFFNGVKNTKFLEHIANSYYSNDWKTLLTLMKHSQMAAIRHFEKSLDVKNPGGNTRNKLDLDNTADVKTEWLRLGKKIAKLELQIKTQASLAFSFIEGSLVNAIKHGHWVLLDEINLASSETLECLSGLLEDQNNSISLIECGNNEPIRRHKDFTLFACMNPATDVGKRDLPVGLRNRFTEFFVDELTDKIDLILLISDYLKNMSVDQSIILSIYKFYISIKEEAQNKLVDGTGQSPHYSLRTLCRALAAAPNAFCGTIARSLYETMCLSFLTQLDSSSHPKVQEMIAKAILGKKTIKSITQVPIPVPKTSSNEEFVSIEGYWVCKGNLPIQTPENYILTSSVRKNLKDLVRIISLGKLPILLQGDTSVGKTSLITYLAKITGNYCVRINNHQHTDLQEYVGSYASDSTGKLIFVEGILVEAMRKGYWIILDELNLAPSEVLEALNRVLDDNKELFIPETQQLVRADPNFILFATQNPPGLYGGRKLLSRAFRNRFVELHFDEIPKNELEIILHQRCHMPLSYSKKVVSIMTELQIRRKGSAAVQGKEGFITLRDLFRWGERYKIASNRGTLTGKYYDWDQHIADEGYLVLAGRVRKPDEQLVIQEVLEKHIKRKVDPENLFSLHESTSSVTRPILEEILNSNLTRFSHIVWTFNMRKLAVLVSKCFYFKEPVLLVGETGCGKTTICEVLSSIRNNQFTSVNCHMHTESSDFLGGLRPVRVRNDDAKLFEWVDGPLIETMKSGGIFLADEISLADDSVLERLNSLLETERQIYLAEKGLNMDDNSENIISAADDFHFIGTMNPGGDYGKKELSPALRNRFTEIWCENITSRSDLIMVLNKNLINEERNEQKLNISENILDFVDWFKATKIGDRITCTIRDLLSWINFINETVLNQSLNLREAYLHGASLVFLDSLGTSFSGSENTAELAEIKHEATKFLLNQLKCPNHHELGNMKGIIDARGDIKFDFERKEHKFGFAPFFIECGHSVNDFIPSQAFNFTVPTTGLNTLRILRGLQLTKPILLEGSPGVGKTSLVAAIAKASGHKILRVNLSDQTDISDLFGADLPTTEGTFAWKDGAFLTALKNGEWILLDELNLAPQPVLEGLNACLDHRGEIFIPELNKRFSVKLGTKIFACQNPLRQGGARRGLPKSFLNRFTQVYIDTLTPNDLLFITKSQYDCIPESLLHNIIEFNSRILKETSDHLWGLRGSPWELNLRDIQRWCDGIERYFRKTESLKPGKFARLLYVDRMRTQEDKDRVKKIYNDIFGSEYPMDGDHPHFYITKTAVHIDCTVLERYPSDVYKNTICDKGLLVLRSQLPVLRSLMQCVHMNWLAILIGPASSGKTSCIQTIAQLLGVELHTLPVTSAMDTSDLLGGFEQTDFNRHLEEIQDEVEIVLMSAVQKLFAGGVTAMAIDILKKWESVKDIYEKDSDQQTIAIETDIFKNKLRKLKIVVNSLQVLNVENINIREEIRAIDNLLNNFSKNIEKETCLNAGGKFEWVDSLLIKCLLNGSWLLVDNVNLCSSAVLDRLNCLLEPNGALTIPERGDALSEIRPHPNFRMFFTMDPKNGEISRAMRNRGVEIYLMGSEEFASESFTDTTPFMDLEALLTSSGIPANYLDVFLSSHNLLASFFESYERPTQYQFLQVAFLAYHQMCRGESAKDAIVNSFSDVYIKSFTSANADVIAEKKNNMLNGLKENVASHMADEKTLCPNAIENHSFSCLGLSRNVDLAKIKQDAYFIALALHKNCHDVTCLSYLLYYFYCQSSYNDLRLRYEYTKKMFMENESFSRSEISWCAKLNESLFVATLKSVNDDNPNLPWCSQSLATLGVQNDLDLNANNRICAYLYYLANLAKRTLDTISAGGHLTILKYSDNVLNDRMPDEYSDHHLLKNCSWLVNAIDEVVTSLLQSDNTKMSLPEWSDLIVKILWLNRFYKMCNKPLFKSVSANNKTKIEINKDSVNDVILHYKWLQKHFLLTIERLNPSCTNSMDSRLTDINKSIASTNSPFRSICKKIKKKLGTPALYPTEETYLRCLKRNRLLKESKALKFLHLNFAEEDILNANSSVLNFPLTIENVLGFPQDIPTREAMEIEIDLSENKIERIEEFAYSAQLWPIQNAVLTKIVNLFKVKLFMHFLDFAHDSNNLSKVGSVSNFAVFIDHLQMATNSFKFIPPKLSFLFSKAQEIKENNMEIISCLMNHSMEIWNIISEYQENSPSCNASFWLNYDGPKLTESSDSREETEVLPINFPQVTYNVVQLTIDNYMDGLSPTPLSSWMYRSRQLSSLQNLLWNNMITLNSFELNDLYLDAKMIILNFERFVIALEFSLMKNVDVREFISEDDSNLISVVVLNCINRINEIYKQENKNFTPEMIAMKNQFNETLADCLKLYHSLVVIMKTANETKNILEELLNKSEFDFMILIGRMWTLYAICNIFIFSEIGTIDIVVKDQLKMNYMQEDIENLEYFLDTILLQNILRGTVHIENETMQKFLEKKFKSDGNKIIETVDDSVKDSINGITCHDSHCSELLKEKRSIMERLEKMSKGKIFRPKTPTFLELSNEFSYFVNTLGNQKALLEHYRDMISAFSKMNSLLKRNQFDSDAINIIKDTTIVIKKYSVWKCSVKYFKEKISKKYTDTFPDIVNPFLNFITQVLYGLNIMKHCLLKMVHLSKFKNCDAMLINDYSETLIRFPIVNKNVSSALSTIDAISSVNFIDFINTIKMSSSNEKNQKEMYNLLKINLQELYCKIVSDGSVGKESWSLATSLLDELVTLRRKQQEIFEKEKQKEDSLYVTRTKCSDLSEEEQNEAEVVEMFPSFLDSDFLDFRPPSSLNSTPKASKKDVKDWDQYFSPKDMELIVTIHSNIVRNFTLAEWLSQPSGKHLFVDYITPLIERYKVLSGYLKEVHYGLKESLDGKALTSLAVLVAQAKSIVDGEDYLDNQNNHICESDSSPNFYLNSWVHESKKCLPMLEMVKSRTLLLLEQWPDFPALKDIITVIDRIMSFPVTSPVARFLTGLELLREKMEEWNKASHKNNSLNDLTIVVAQQIVSWRKIELSGWKESLNNVHDRLKSNANKWWFHMYALVNSFVHQEEALDSNIELFIGSGSVSKNNFTVAMQQFMERSPLVEFQTRLEILYTFHCHAIHMSRSKKRDELLCILWNIYKYYSQYSAHIANVVKEKRAPIEKKLKDFVKICTWERDLSYWSVKDLVFKSQKTLHKYMKEFEEILKQDVSLFLVPDKSIEATPNTVGLWDRPKRNASTKAAFHYKTDVNTYIVPMRIYKKYFAEVGEQAESNSKLFRKLEAFTFKAKDFCKIAISKSPFPLLLQNLDDVTTQIIDSIVYFRSLEVDSTVPKPKQKSMIKSQLQQKKKGLSDLFRTLSKIGISYKSGLLESSLNQDKILNFEIPPVNFTHGFSYLKNKRCDVMLLAVWKDCEFYHQRCIARFGGLKNPLSSPAADLGHQNVERIKGFATNYMLLLNGQKLKISKYSRELCYLRYQINLISDLCEFPSSLPRQSNLLSYLEKLKNIYSTIITTIKQFTLVMKAFPDTSDEVDNKIKFDSKITKNEVSKDTTLWQDTYDKIKSILLQAQKQNDSLNGIASTFPFTFINKKSEHRHNLVIGQSHLEVMYASLKFLFNVKQEVSNTILKFNVHMENEVAMENPISNSLTHLNGHIESVLDDLEPQFAKIHSSSGADHTSQSNPPNEFSNTLETLTNDVLLTIQMVYKRITLEDPKEEMTDPSKTSEESAETEEDDTIKESHLKKELVENIENNLSEFHISLLNSKIHSLIQKLDGNVESEVIASKKQLLKFLPLLEQISLFAQFFICQQVSTFRVSCKMLSVILNIFSELCQKGFCTPADANEEAGEEKGQGKLAGGTGLADGEGEKDVSDQIENQDQLDDVLKAGSEKNKSEDKDCKEEENGVEMTDDFESHLQDVEEKQQSDNENEEDEDDMDKQMDQTGEEGNKLDEQLWGSDEDDEEETNTSNNEEKRSGAPAGEKNLEAKEDNADSGDEEGNEDDKKKKNKDDINKLEEPDYDDNQIDPYHGNQKPMPEPEPMELPEDTNINDDDDREDEQEENAENNPFEIDVMKDKKSKESESESKKKDDAEKKENLEDGKNLDGSSDSEEENEVTNDEEETTKNDGEKEDNDDLKDEDNVDEEETSENQNEKPEESEEANVPENDKLNKNTEEISDDKENDKENDEENEDTTEHPDNKSSSESKMENEEMKSGSKDTVQTNPFNNNDDSVQREQSQEQEGDDKEGFGQSELSKDQKGHMGNKKDRPQSSNEKNNPDSKNSRKRNKPGEVDDDRVLGELNESVQKKMKTINKENEDVPENEEEEGVGENSEDNTADLYQHIKKATKYDSQMIDTATKEQAEKQPLPNKEEEEAEDCKADDVEMDVEEDIQLNDEPNQTIEPEKCSKDRNSDRENKASGGDQKGDDVANDMGVEIEGENVLTLGAERNSTTTYHTKLDSLQTTHFERSSKSDIPMHELLHSSKPDIISSENNAAWQKLWRQTSVQARLLTEKLRLVLEPTGLSRLAGDYRTGKRINMRKVIPYIASHFRKDRIWLRRTKPARREYKIAVAIDDSSSMSDNQSKELAFESLALISQALNYLEAGELSILSFGENTQIIHPFSEPFTESSGSQVLQKLTFEQSKTRIAQMVEFASAMFERLCGSSNVPNAKLLLIVSDGRGIFSEGEAKVLRAIRLARQQRIFVVYLIVDNPANQSSIMDIRVPVFDAETGAFKHVQPYLDSFPFPFYLILRDITALPAVLSDAMRQWFELAANLDKH